LDPVTLGVIEKGMRNVEILKQAQNDPFTVEDQVAIIYLGSKNLLKSVPVDKVKEFEKKFLELMNLKYRKTLDSIKEGKLTDDVITALEKVGAEISSSYE
jgi:F-type H+-transporting ATPase subunit alpha